eukprot:s1620_g11.t1
MLAGSVSNCLQGLKCKCAYLCDTDFGRDHCIPKGITATPAECQDWIADTGSAQDLVNDRELSDDYGYYSDNPIRMITANGESSSAKQGRVFVPKLGKTIDPYLVKSTPPVISIGMRCIDDGYDFVLRGSKGEDPYLKKPNGERIELVVKDYVPYLANNSTKIATPSTIRRPSVTLPAFEEAQQSPEPDGEIEIIGDEPIEALEPQPVEMRAVENVDAEREVEPPDEQKSRGSTKVDAENFGDHITADVLVTRDEEEVGIDDEKTALVVKDVATGFMYVYPNARRTTSSAVLAMKHLIGNSEKIGVFYSDNAPELISAMKVLNCRHVLSRDYISQSNAKAERAFRSVLEGTRVNLLQAGFNHWHGPHAARHWCFMQNVVARGGEPTPWEMRFGSKFDGPLFPFGCLVEYWNGPRKKNKEGLRFDPTSSSALFLGYAIHPEFSWRKEFMVAPTKNLLENEANGTAEVLRVLKVIKLEDNKFPLQGRSIFGKHDPGQDEALGNHEPTLEDQDAKPVIDPSEEDDSQPSTANALHDEKWVAFLNHIKNREGWYQYAGCHVNIKENSESYVKGNDTFDIEDFPYRATCHRKDGAWFILDENFIMRPEYDNPEAAVATCEVMASIFHKEISVKGTFLWCVMRIWKLPPKKAMGKS